MNPNDGRKFIYILLGTNQFSFDQSETSCQVSRRLLRNFEIITHNDVRQRMTHQLDNEVKKKSDL